MHVSGRVSPFIELGVGFNPDLTARDNVLINAIMLGLSRKEARAQFDQIIEFAELDEFVDLKLKNYSTGMGVRLGFSVAIQVQADVILVDEVLAVGDASFQQKCFSEFERLKREGRTILFVTHDMNSVERFCDRGLVLERGRVADLGPPDQIARTYGELNFGQVERPPGETAPAPESAVRFLGAWCEGPDGSREVVSRQGEDLLVNVRLAFSQAVDHPDFTLTFRNEARHTVLVATTQTLGVPSGRFEPGEQITLRCRVANRFAPGRYTITAMVGDNIRGYGAYGYAEDIAAVIVQALFHTGGLVDMPFDLSVERG
jgi:ABC-type multidrug transport system ATPase subunit